MTKQIDRTTPILLYSAEVGNNGCRIASSEVSNVIQFEPLIAPETERRGIAAQDIKPTYSLQINGRPYVFGIDDVFGHGRRASMRRLNSMERYTNEDYFRLLDVLFLHAFSTYVDTNTLICPTGVIAVPIVIYNNTEIITEMRNSLVNKSELIDRDGRCLIVEIQAKRLQLVPESYGALMHYAYDPVSLKKRPEVSMIGTTLVIDVGYETTDFSLYEGLVFQRDRAESVTRAGIGVITRTIHEYVEKCSRAIEVSRVDRALRTVAGKTPDALKEIEPTPGVFIDVTQVYDYEIDHLANRIAQEALTRFPEAISRILLAGGGAYHLHRALRQYLSLPMDIVPDPEFANVLGGFTALKLQSGRGR